MNCAGCQFLILDSANLFSQKETEVIGVGLSSSLDGREGAEHRGVVRIGKVGVEPTILTTSQSHISILARVRSNSSASSRWTMAGHRSYSPDDPTCLRTSPPSYH